MIKEKWYKYITVDVSIAGYAYPVDAPGFTPSGVHAIPTSLCFFLFVVHYELMTLFVLTIGYTTFYKFLIH